MIGHKYNLKKFIILNAGTHLRKSTIETLEQGVTFLKN